MADSPKEAEAAQALFCAIVDYEGKLISPVPKDYQAFKKKYSKSINAVKSKVKTPGINLTRIESLLNVSKNKWYHSSVNIANKLFEDIGTISAATHQKISPVGIDLFYVRGDKSSQTVMKDIATIFKHVNEQVKKRNKVNDEKDLVFSDLNKWSPADIYMASTYGRATIKKLASGQNLTQPVKGLKTSITSLSSFVSFSILNEFMKLLIDSGDLIGLSLKKAPNADSVKIKTINFIEGDVAKTLRQQTVGYHGYIFNQTDDYFNSKDVYIKFTTQSKHKLQFRDKGGTGGGVSPWYSYQGIVTGGLQALDGSIGGGSIGDVFHQTNKSMGDEFSLSSQKRLIDKAVEVSQGMQTEMDVEGDLDKSLANQLCNEVYKYAKDYGSGSIQTVDENKKTVTPKTKKEFYTALYKHPQFSRHGTSIMIGPKDDKVRLQNEELQVRARAQYLFGKCLGGRMIKGLAGTTEKAANEMVTNLVLYAGSRTKASSPHYKLSDVSSF